MQVHTAVNKLENKMEFSSLVDDIVEDFVAALSERLTRLCVEYLAGREDYAMSHTEEKQFEGPDAAVRLDNVGSEKEEEMHMHADEGPVYEDATPKLRSQVQTRRIQAMGQCCPCSYNNNNHYGRSGCKFRNNASVKETLGTEEKDRAAAVRIIVAMKSSVARRGQSNHRRRKKRWRSIPRTK